MAYSHKYQIQLRGPGDIAGLGEAGLNARFPKTTDCADTWCFGQGFRDYKTDSKGFIRSMSKRKTGPRLPFGGDYLDVTSWSSAERMQCNFDKKDPLGNEEITAIKKGLVIQVR